MHTQHYHIRGLRKSIALKMGTMAVLALFAAGLLSSCNNKPGNVPAGTYTSLQSVFCLNILSNVSAHFNDSTTRQAKTQAAIDSVLADSQVQGLIGKWTRVWGPVVLSYDKKALNTMYIAQLANSNTYVVAIAGTDATSKADWLLEDFEIEPMHNWKWNNNKDSTMKITHATHTGLFILSSMRFMDPVWYDVKAPITAEDFLALQAKKAKQPINVWVTGHSLGGALSATYALYLNDKKNVDKINADWKGSTINCLAVAGASPGNADFSNYFTKELGKNTYRVWNQLDVVPHGFQVSMMNQVPTLYSGDTLVAPFVLSYKGITVNTDSMLKWIDSVSAKNNLLQLYPADTISYVSNYYNPAKDTTKGSVPFAIEALYQHVPAYGVFFGVLTFQQAAARVLGESSPFFTIGDSLTNIVSYDTTGKNFNANKF